MFCPKCGSKVDHGMRFCPYCGSVVGEVLNQPVNSLSVTTQNSNISTSNKASSRAKKIAFFCGIFLAAYIGIGLFAIYDFYTELADVFGYKFKCTSKKGEIIIYFDGDRISRYKADGYEFNQKEQSAISERIGSEQYMREYSIWFEENNDDGYCYYGQG